MNGGLVTRSYSINKPVVNSESEYFALLPPPHCEVCCLCGRGRSAITQSKQSIGTVFDKSKLDYIVMQN